MTTHDGLKRIYGVTVTHGGEHMLTVDTSIAQASLARLGETIWEVRDAWFKLPLTFRTQLSPVLRLNEKDDVDRHMLPVDTSLTQASRDRLGRAIWKVRDAWFGLPLAFQMQLHPVLRLDVRNDDDGG